ncbi:DNA polymerase III, tau subunit [Marininema mesophilum]|uniref:DNA-directed DNA polymerase n=1 Tax=Marininema mesophilum TaxID=1048340 RepID=A0A1H3AC10_9BACL|nr:DNA polymerase III subunit gamma/tau [Marininema mesophilum]SDX26399.1 DNA polymerase III, tau subunit [Marininema mesophilum]
MSYRALYRVWRPQTFKDLVGQEHVTKTLENALSEGHISHAYLFSGPRGTGKTSAAKIMAKAVNCLQGPGPEPCNECEICRKITEGSLMDVVEIDAASNRGVDEIRDLRDKVKYAPSEGRYKVYIIDEVHMLTTEAFNALLKTLEEPPDHVVFILATTEPHKLPATIISRCQRFSFRRHTMGNLLARLGQVCEAQGVETGDGALVAIAQAADGGMRDALSLLDQVLSFSPDKVNEEAVLSVTGSVSRKVLAELMESIVCKDAKTALDRVDRLLMEGLEAERLVQDLILLARDLLVHMAAPELDEVKARLANDEVILRLTEQRSISGLGSILDALIDAQQRMKWAAHPRILLEMTLVRLCQPVDLPQGEAPQEQDDNISRLAEQVRQLEARVAELSQLSSDEAPSVKSTASVGDEEGRGKKHTPVQSNRGGVRSASSSVAATQLLQQSSPEELQQVKQRWPEVLAQVKERKITVHAWLIDGEPVATSEEGILLVFKNAIHRETTEKEGNKTLIQQVIEEVFGSPKKLITIMRGEWERHQGAMQTSATVVEPAAPQPNREKPSSAEKVDPVQRAVEFFGEDLIEVTD